TGAAPASGGGEALTVSAAPRRRRLGVCGGRQTWRPLWIDSRSVERNGERDGVDGGGESDRRSGVAVHGGGGGVGEVHRRLHTPRAGPEQRRVPGWGAAVFDVYGVAGHGRACGRVAVQGRPGGC